MNWYMEACPVCRGTMHDDLDDKGWVTCFSCARSFRAPGVHLAALIPPESVESQRVAAETPLKRAA